MPEGRESPDPETQSGAQLKDTPADGQGINKTENKAEKINEEVQVSITTSDRISD